MSYQTLDYRAVDWKSLTSPEILCSSCRNITLDAVYDGLDLQISDEPCGLCEAIVALCRTRGQTPTVARLEMSDTIGNRKTPIVGFRNAIADLLSGYDDLDEVRQSLRTKYPWTKRFFKLHPWPFALIYVRASHSRDIIAYLKAIPHVPSGLSKIYSVGREVRPYSESSTEMIKHWISDCLANHPNCRMQISGNKLTDEQKPVLLPTRLIDVSSDAPRLRITHGQRGRYAALSYCWGGTGEPDTLLTKAKLQPFQNCIPLSSLRKTIKDAIFVARGLGIPYLWVDSLCIIQDDTEDWNAEAPQMGRLYEMAFVTIAALGADTADDGLFLSQEDSSSTHPSESWNLQIPHSNSKKVAELSTLTFWPRTDRERDPYAEEFERARWRSRGWVVQERLLSRRIVYFGRYQIYWSCKMEKRREDGLANFPKSSHENKVFYDNYSAEQQDLSLAHFWLPRLLRKTPGFMSLMEAWQNQTFSNLWNQVVVDYSSCHLTFVADKEKAIEGLVRLISKQTKMTCWLGLWKETIHYGLGWRGMRALPESDSSISFASWSWLSRDGPVDFWSRSLIFDMPVLITMKDVAFESSSGLSILSMTTSILRVNRSESLTFESHLPYTALYYASAWKDWPYNKESERCGQCEPGKCRHAFLLNQMGYVYGFVEFDNEACRRDTFDCMILFENTIESLGECDRYLVLKQLKKPFGRRMCFLVVEKTQERPNLWRRLGSGAACTLRRTDIKPDDIMEAQVVKLV